MQKTNTHRYRVSHGVLMTVDMLGKYSHRHECVQPIHSSIYLPIRPSVCLSVRASIELHCCHYHCLRSSFNKVEKGILITNYMNSIDPHTPMYAYDRTSHFTMLFWTERWLIVVDECCVRCDVRCVMCVSASTYSVNSNLFRQQFYLNVQNCRTLTEDNEYHICMIPSNQNNVGYPPPPPPFKFIFKPINAFVERMCSLSFCSIRMYCETMSSFFRCK